MKNSNAGFDLLDLERDLPVTQEDILALRKLRAFPKLDLQSYLNFLASFAAPPPERIRRRNGPAGGRPFTLNE